MTEELITTDGGSLVAAAREKGLGELFQPLIREIHLFDTWVAGTTHLEDPSVLDTVREGDKLTLRREDNKFDEHAILIFTGENRRLGYIPEKDNLVFARLMDAGKSLTARVKKHEMRGSFHQITIGICLGDF